MRVRFAPSPTGALHIGGARTALYNWLLARGNGGELVLRVEDTDRERSTPENVEQIFDALGWLGIDWDGDPVFQSRRAERHRGVLEQLLEAGRAYRSTATADDVRAWKAQHGDERGFRGEPQEEGAIRLRVPDEGETVVEDLIRGTTTFRHAHLDDPVIARADGSVLYNFAVAVDDLDAGITHVVRGEDHLSNTPKQLLVYEALGEAPPRYAHLPLLHGPDGRKLSKRHGAASVQELRDAGYLPEAVRNYLALLGWGHGDDTKLSTEELQRLFRVEDVARNPARFDEAKLRWLNGLYLRELSPDELARRLTEHTQRQVPAQAAQITQEKIQTLADFWPLAGFLFDGPADDPAARERVLGRDGARDALAQARAELAGAPEPFDVAAVEHALRHVVEARGAKPKDVFQPVRLAIAGTTVSPGIFESVATLGREETLRRIDALLEASGA
ncbi:MAG TPA: glutamate--tRNA ligase [Solirubrobacteraceae bacterium]|nr:glutamate--tRNA ligase [Solirubrobacteraceae bacterium]